MTTFETMTTETFAAEFPRARGCDTAVSYLVAPRAKARDYRRIIASAEAMATDGYKTILCGQTNHSRQYTTYRFAIIPAGADAA